MKIFLLFLTVLFGSIIIESQGSLWDQIIKPDQVLLSVQYHGRRLNVWKEENKGRYFVTPLCVMDPNSVRCDVDEFSDQEHYTFTFKVLLWDTFAATTIQLALLGNGIEAKASDIHPLPMQNVRLSINREDMTSTLKLDNRWLSYQNQPDGITMNVGVKNGEFCKNMTTLATSDPAAFLSKTKLSFEFTMSVVHEEIRIFKITGSTIAKTDFFTNLTNDYSDKEGNVYLNSKDLNDLARDIYRTVSIIDKETAGYIKSDEESQIIEQLLNEIKGQQVQSVDLEKREWDSVFWDDIFARPDIQTEYFNDTFSYDSNKSHFIFDETKENEFRNKIENRYANKRGGKVSGGGGFSFLGLKFGASGGRDNQNEDHGENVNHQETKDKHIVTQNNLQELIDSKEANVKWTGTKFTMKNLNLQRINTKALQSSGDVVYKRIVTSDAVSSHVLPILPDPTKDPTYDKPPLYYDMLEKKFEEMSNNLKASIAQINERLGGFEGDHGNTKGKLSTLIECSHAAGQCTHLPIAQ